MPKIIKGINENIIACAMKLFEHHDYEEIDMKMIADELGIAVGTLYNYVPNKKTLYLNVHKMSWQKTFDRMDQKDKLPISDTEKIEEYIVVLYEDIEKRKGIRRALIKNITSLSEDIEANGIKERLISKINKLLFLLMKDGDDSKEHNDNRLAETLITTILVMVELHPGEKEKNITFIVKMLNSFLR